MQNGGARLAPELRRRLRDRLGCTPQEIYGTAEGLINMTRLDDPDDLLLESSGAPVCDDDEIMVVDDDGPRGRRRRRPASCVTRGPYTIRGYYNAPEQERRGLHCPTASTGWATSCAGAAATSSPKAGARTSSTAAARRSAARRSRT